MKKLYSLLVASIITATAFSQITMVEDINPGTGNSSPANLFKDGSYIYFAADDAAATTDHGKELWRTNGSTAELVKDLRDGTGNSTPSYFFSYNNSLYFSAHNGSSMVLFSTDGTADNTVDLNLGTGVFTPTALNNVIYFINTTAGNLLYTFDGTSFNTADNNGSIGAEWISTGNMIGFNNKLIMYMKTDSESSTVGTELYQYDPSTGIYALIKDITADASSSSISNLTVMGTKVYFEALNTLWETDGTTDGTIEVSAASGIEGVANLFVWNDKLYFEGDNGTDGDQLYAYDPSYNTVTDLSNLSGTDHNPSDFCVYDGYLYYSGTPEGSSLKYLFRTDGTSITQLDETIQDIDEIIELNGILYFEGDNGTSGNELFSFDPASYIPNAIDRNYLNSLSLYPNPTNGIINISGLENSNAEYTVYDISGRTVLSGIVTNQINLNIASGIYIIELKDGNKISTHKVQVK